MGGDTIYTVLTEVEGVRVTIIVMNGNNLHTDIKVRKCSER